MIDERARKVMARVQVLDPPFFSLLSRTSDADVLVIRRTAYVERLVSRPGIRKRNDYKALARSFRLQTTENFVLHYLVNVFFDNVMSSVYSLLLFFSVTSASALVTQWHCGNRGCSAAQQHPRQPVPPLSRVHSMKTRAQR